MCRFRVNGRPIRRIFHRFQNAPASCERSPSQFLFPTALKTLRGVDDVSADIAEMKVRPIHRFLYQSIKDRIRVVIFFAFRCCCDFEVASP